MPPTCRLSGHDRRARGGPLLRQGPEASLAGWTLPQWTACPGQGEAERPLEYLQRRLERTLRLGAGTMTSTEARVADLVAEGLTNPQIGERMFVSPSTVKTHLAHIFRKRDVRSRGELGARAGERHRART
jgi:DNA-binding CsgD family transcriptional regulator